MSRAERDQGLRDGMTTEERDRLTALERENRDVKTLQKFAAVHASIHNHFNQDRHLNRRRQNRSAVLAEWRQLAA